MNLRKESKNGVQIFFVEKDLYQKISKIDLKNKFLKLKNAVFCKEIDNLDLKNQKVEIWISQPFYGDFEIVYEDSEIFEKFLVPKNKLERQKYNFTGFLTNSLILKNNHILSYSIQNISKHKDIDQNGLCYRERLRKRGKINSGEGYELCNGCNHSNHSEVLAVEKILQKNPKEQELQNLTAYLYGHWWSCANCSQNMSKLGVKKLIICKSWVEKFLNI